jgi:two-component system sensor histidine kinase CreC
MRIALRLLLGFFLVLGLALFVVLRVFLGEVEPGTRLAMEDSLVDAAYAYAQLAGPDMKAGVIASGGFAQAMAAYRKSKPGAVLWGFHKDQVDTRITITDARGIVVFDSLGQTVGQDHSRWNDVFKTLRGAYGARSSVEDPADPDSTVMHVAAPIRDGERIIGVLTASRPNQLLEPYIERSRQRILLWSWVLLGVSLLTGLLFSWWMASSLSRLRSYANAVAEGERAQLPRMGQWSGRTEFHDLAQAVERMRLKLEDKAYVESYVHTLTHELKSPLAAIRGASELLQEPMTEADQQRFAGHIQRQTERLQHLIADPGTVAGGRSAPAIEGAHGQGRGNHGWHGGVGRSFSDAAGIAKPAGQRHRIFPSGWRAGGDRGSGHLRADGGVVGAGSGAGCARLRERPGLRAVLLAAPGPAPGQELRVGVVPGERSGRPAWRHGERGQC